MASATKYVDNVAGNNGNTGDSEAQAYADLATAVGAITGGGNIIYLQATGTPYAGGNTITAALKGDTTDGRNRIEGYTTTPGARDGRPVITSSTNSQALFTLNDNDFWEFVHLELTHTAATRGIGVAGSTSTSTPLWIIDCIFDGCLQATQASTLLGNLRMEDCEVKNCTSTTIALGVPTSLTAFGCEIHDNAGDGIRDAPGGTTSITCRDCLIYSNDGIGINDVSTNTNVVISLSGCSIAGNVGSGVKAAAKASNSVTFELFNNIFSDNGAGAAGYNLENLDTQAEADTNVVINRRNFYHDGTSSGDITGLAAGFDDVTLTGDPFTNLATGDLSLNNTAGAGAAVREAAFPGVFPRGTTTSYRDGGAAQHEDVGGGGGGIAGSIFGGGVVR